MVNFPQEWNSGIGETKSFNPKWDLWIHYFSKYFNLWVGDKIEDRLPDLVSKYTEYLVKFEFQMNKEKFLVFWTYIH